MTLRIQAGATCAITDPAKMGLTVRATELLLGRDAHALRYLKHYRLVEKLRQAESL
ncbi:MAG: hypothetical protein RMJ60_01935 [Anaerolineales bacterium]|nr:hypothetical protein [Anaerolineales bacterium]